MICPSRRGAFGAGQGAPKRRLVIPNERGATPPRAKCAPSLRVAPEIGACRVAKLVRRITTHGVSRLAGANFKQQREGKIIGQQTLSARPGERKS